MVRGSCQLAPWLRALGRQGDKVRRSLCKDIPEDQPWRIINASVDAPPLFFCARSSFGDVKHPGFSACMVGQIAPRVEADFVWANSAHLVTLAGADIPSSPEKKVVPQPVPPAVPEKPKYYAASQYPGAPEPRPENDRYFRARNNSNVAHMLKLLEAAPSSNDVEKILNDRINDLTGTKRWPWLPLLDALQRGPKPYLALEVFNWKKDKIDGGDPKEYAKMISTAGKLSQLDLASKLFKDMELKGLKRAPITCNALMSAFSKNDRPDLAVAMFKEMNNTDDCKPTLVTYNTLISMYSKLSVKEMENYFHSCKNAGFSPDRVTYNSMIWGYMRAGQFDDMEEMYAQLRKAGCKPDPITFSALIIGFSKASNLEKMESAFTHMEEEGFPINTMIAEIMVEFYAAERKFEKMERIIKIVTNTTGTSCSSRIYGFAIQAYAESGRMTEMEDTIEKMFTSRRLFTSSKALESVIMAYGSRAKFEELEKILQRIKSNGWAYQQSTFHALLYEYGKGRQFDKMEAIFEEMQAASDIQPTQETYQILADSYDSAGDEVGLSGTIRRMQAAGFSTQTVTEKEVEKIWTDEEIFDGRRH